MKKFNKDQIQKIILSGIMLLILVYVYFQFLLGPLGQAAVANQTAIGDLQTKITEAQKQIQLGKNATESSRASVETMKVIEGMIPQEAPIAWLPPMVNRFYAARGADKVSLQLQNSEAIPATGLEKFKYFTWQLSFSPLNFLTAASAISDMENEMPLVSVTSIKVDASPGSPEEQRIVCEIKTLLK